MKLLSVSDHCRFAGTKASHQDAVYYYKHEACEVSGKIDADRDWRCLCSCHITAKKKAVLPVREDRSHAPTRRQAGLLGEDRSVELRPRGHGKSAKLAEMLKNLKAKKKEKSFNHNGKE